ncbi:MAG: cysteine desulfurase family protein [Planctomycetota bacterium]|nr:cysteine desulfurase family protein [Planctomycetota bacterium]MDA1165625.1 cysteine desulfurase family protein [Planctomycetota bacterium]
MSIQDEHTNGSAAADSATETATEPGRIFLDANSTTRPLPEVIETVAHHLRLAYANPGSRHAEGRKARRALEESRERIAELLGASANEVVFTSGGTEASNMAIFGFTSSLPEAIALTAGEHPATTESCRSLMQRGWKLLNMDVDAHGRLLPDQFPNLPWEQLKLVTLILAHNETGVIQDTAELARLCQERGVPLHIDAVQAVGKIPVNFRELKATSLSLGAHKFHGPRGIGALLLRDGVQLAPLQYGGHQESGRRPGTEMVALAAGMARALEICHSDMDLRIGQLKSMRDELEQRLQATCEPTVLNSSAEQRLPNTLNISFPGVDGEALLVALDLEGIACSLGSTCASGSAEPAPVLMAMGRLEDVYKSAVRFSLSSDNYPEEIPIAAHRIARVIERLRSGVNS